MSEQPTHAMLVRADDGLHLLPACTSRECAERTINFAEGGQVVGVTYLYPEPIPGVQFWSAVQLGNAPKTSVDFASVASEAHAVPSEVTDALMKLTPRGWVLVPMDLPVEVLGEAAIIGAFDTGNPAHGWTFLLGKVARYRLGDIDPRDIPSNTGHPQIDRLIGRLTSADPDFDDCTEAALLLREFAVRPVPPATGDQP